MRRWPRSATSSVPAASPRSCADLLGLESREHLAAAVRHGAEHLVKAWVFETDFVDRDAEAFEQCHHLAEAHQTVRCRRADGPPADPRIRPQCGAHLLERC